MRRPHILQFIYTAKLKCPDVLYDPALAYPINFLVTDHAATGCLLPNLESQM